MDVLRPASDADAAPAAAVPDVRLGGDAAGFGDAVGLFLGRTLHTRSGSPHTQCAYRTDLAHYGAFLAARSLAFDHVSRRDAGVYLARISAEAAARSVRRRVSCVRSFYRFLRGVELVDSNPFDALDLPEVDRKSETHKVLTDDELARAVALLASDVADAHRRFGAADRGPDRTRAFAALFTCTRRRAAFTLMAFVGLRRAEVVGLTRDALVERPDGFYLSFVGKGGKTRTVPLVGFAYPVLFDWLAVRRLVPTPAAEVLVTLTGRAVLPSQVKREVHRVGERAHTRYALTPHVLRRTFATRSLRASGDIRSVQVLLGHASIGTTEVYTHVDEAGLRALVESTALAPRHAATASPAP